MNAQLLYLIKKYSEKQKELRWVQKKDIDGFLRSERDIKILQTGTCWENKINKLPKGLHKLILGQSFNQKLEVLQNMKKLKVLKFGMHFDKELFSTIQETPPNLKVLKVNGFYKEKIINFPKRLKVLKLYSYEQPMPQNVSLPKVSSHQANWGTLKNLRTFTFNSIFNQGLENFLRNSNKLKKLKLGEDFDQNLGNYLKTCKNIKILILHGGYNRFLEEKTLNFSNEVKKNSETKIYNPSNDFCSKKLKVLQLGDYYNGNINFQHATSLRVLRFGYKFDRKLGSILPPRLKILKLGFCFNQFLDNLPKKLKILKLGYTFNQSLDSLPENLKVLKLGANTNVAKGRFLKRLKKLRKLVLFKNQLEKIKYPISPKIKVILWVP